MLLIIFRASNNFAFHLNWEAFQGQSSTKCKYQNTSKRLLQIKEKSKQTTIYGYKKAGRMDLPYPFAK